MDSRLLPIYLARLGRVITVEDLRLGGPLLPLYQMTAISLVKRVMRSEQAARCKIMEADLFYSVSTSFQVIGYNLKPNLVTVQ